MSVSLNEAWIVDAVRTPRGIGRTDRGALAGLHPQTLLASAFQGLQQRVNFDPSDLDDVIVGCGLPEGRQGNDIGRMAVLDAGWPTSAGGATVSRFCGSGITALNLAAASVMSGLEDLVVAGGVEMMSYTSKLAPRAMDAGNMRLRARYPQAHQGVCADAIATLEGVSRETLDDLALESQRRAAEAIAAGRLSKSLLPVISNGEVLLSEEQFPRPSTTREGLSALRPAFEHVMDLPIDESGATSRQLFKQAYPDLVIRHLHHAGNSSGVVDGAAAALLAAPARAKSLGLRPRARVRAIANVGGDPVLMLNEPVSAAKKVLARARMTTRDIDLFEVNEAFAVVAWKFMRDLDIDPAICNVNGGAIALGHPIGATGIIMLATVLDELERRDKESALVTMCAGGGLAPAIIIERL